MYKLSNILPTCGMAEDYSKMSNELYYSELDCMGGGNSQFAKAYLTNIIPSMSAQVVFFVVYKAAPLHEALKQPNGRETSSFAA